GLLKNQKILISQGFRGTFVEFICKENTENR
ncbi:hypothetical protein SAMN05421868_1812, partial [Paenibacillus naphthalenovorans]